MWTRIITRQMLEAEDASAYKIGADLDNDNLEKYKVQNEATANGQIIFNPNDVQRLKGSLSVENNKLSKEQLQFYTRLATKVR